VRSQELQSSDVLQLKSTVVLYTAANHADIIFHLELRGGFDTNGELIVLQRNSESEGDKKCDVRVCTRRRRHLRR
jgi:hypothetical protein